MHTMPLLNENKCKSHLNIAVMVLLCCGLLTSCQPDIQSVEPTPNPYPKEIYEITVTVENAPGEFTTAEGIQEFYIINSSQCIPPYTSMSGAPSVAISDFKKISYERVSPNTFVTTVVLDAYVPKDDYGRGLCKWGPAEVSVTLRQGSNDLYASITPPEVLVAKRASRIDFFNWKQPDNNSGISIPSRPVDESNKAEYPQSLHFYTIMKAKKVSP